KKIRINLNVPLKSVKQKENGPRIIDQAQKMVIQAPIVRIMKDRETFKHELLIQEVIKQLSSRFEPKISVIE
ncbi:unnamed protein product, partial [Rotaria sordida]